jgi:hypothetical protein
MPSSRKLGVVAAIVLFFITVGAAVFVVKSYLMPDETGESAAGPSAPPTVAAPGQIQVGIYLSDFSATGPHRQATPYGYVAQLRPLHSLHDESIRLLPVVEPGTARKGALARLITQNFSGQQTLDASKATDLEKLDVLVATAAANVPDAVAAAIDQCVRQGMGLLQRQFGYLTPGYNPQTSELNGFAQATFGWSANPVDCEIVAAHPLLGDLSGKVGQTISLVPNGAVGALRGVPLLRVKDMKQLMLVNADHPVGTGEYLYPLYISQLGRGKIVGIGYTQGKDIPPELESANHDRFYIHCVQWLAGKPLQ